MTVCIAALFRWNYAKPGEDANHGIAAITASDRMITAADVQYEPQQQKIALFGNTLVMIAGDIGIHSQAIRATEKEVRGRELHPHDIAIIYGRAIQAVNRRHAENEILAPLGLNTDTFMAQQKDLSEGFVKTITSQLQNRRPVDVEALVVGTDGENSHIFSVDAYGNDISLDDVGFGAIGIGAWHAKSRLMQIGHVNTRIFAPTLASIFAAKKNAEIAPGVGNATDIQIVLKTGVSPLWSKALPELDRLYQKYSTEVSKFGEAMVNELQVFINTPQSDSGKDDQGPPGKDTQADAGASEDAREAASENNAKKKSKYSNS